ncbi:MAG: hypothetical protein ACLFWL_02370 [Candidatus Brocadiia bacterium]
MPEHGGNAIDKQNTSKQNEQSKGEKEDQEKQDVPEAAPTDLGRHLNLLIAILGVVVLAWIVKVAHTRIDQNLDLSNSPIANTAP